MYSTVSVRATCVCALNSLFDEMTQKSAFGFDLFIFFKLSYQSESRRGNIPTANKRRSKQAIGQKTHRRRGFIAYSNTTPADRIKQTTG